MHVLDPEPRPAVQLQIIVGAPLHIVNRPPVVNIKHDRAHHIARARSAVLGKLARGERRPFVLIHLRCTHEIDHASVVAQPLTERAEQPHPAVPSRNVVKGERREHHIVLRAAECIETAVWQLSVVAACVESTRLRQHLGGDVNARDR